MLVTLIAKTIPTEKLGDLCVPWAENQEDILEFAGRICYNSVDKFGENPKYLKGLIKAGHESVIEHASASFLIEDVSRSCLAQITRHRLFSFSVESSRYVDQSTCGFVCPPDIELNEEAEDAYHELLTQARKCYTLLRGLGIKKEDARFVLPQSQMCRLVMTGNLRSWRHFIEMRCDKAAQWEIHKVAIEILNILSKEFPNVFRDQYKKYIYEGKFE